VLNDGRNTSGTRCENRKPVGSGLATDDAVGLEAGGQYKGISTTQQFLQTLALGRIILVQETLALKTRVITGRWWLATSYHKANTMTSLFQLL
jgi:hypothetical protein